jgi:hypothetical protein
MDERLPLLIGIELAAKLLGVSHRQIYRYAETNQLTPAVRRPMRFERYALERFWRMAILPAYIRNDKKERSAVDRGVLDGR